MKIGILGAGFTGIELGRKLNNLGQDIVIFEKESQIGGLCRTNKTGEYRWDFAVHAIYSRHKEAMDYFYSLPLDYEYLNRNVKIFHSTNNGKKHIISYPFEIGIKELSLQEKLKCIKGYLYARMKNKKHYPNLKEWIDNRLGDGIAKYFMVPYNNKIWNASLSDISEELVSSKIEPAPTIEFISNILGKPTVGRAYQAKFIYPRRGIQALMDYTAKDIKEKIFLGAKIEKLIKDDNGWLILTSDGIKRKVDTVISTIPLVELLKQVDLQGLDKKYDELKWNNTFFIMVGLKKAYDCNLIKNCHWVFFKEDEVFYRITLMHNFSSEFLPMVVAEVTQKGDIINKSEQEIKDLVIKDFIRLGIIGSIDQIAEIDIKLVEYTYPIPTVGLRNVKEKIKAIFEKNNLFLLGRSGNWDYINMDGVIMNVSGFVSEKFPKHLGIRNGNG